MKPFVSILRLGGSDSSGDRFEGKEQKERKNQPKKKLEMAKTELGTEIRRETREDKKKNEILKILER